MSQILTMCYQNGISLFWRRGVWTASGSYLHRMDETLVECERDDVESKVPYTGLGVEEDLQHLLQIQLHDGAAHP